MFLFRKNIILVPSDYDGVSQKKGIISLDCFNGMSKGTLKCYNLDLAKTLVLGISIDGTLSKFDIDLSKPKTFEFVIKQNIKNTSEISAVLLDIDKDDYAIVLWGSTQINLAWQHTLRTLIEEDVLPKPVLKQSENTDKDIIDTDYQQDENLVKTYNVFDMENDENICENSSVENIVNNFDNNSQTEATEQEKLDNFIDSVIEMTEENCDEIENFSCQNNAQSKTGILKNKNNDTFKKDLSDFDEKQNKYNQPKTASSFYEKLSGQIDKMFEINQPFEVLNEIFPNSKFCKVAFDDGSGYYVFGVIYDEGVAKYLCYGMPAQKGDAPPKEFSELYQWLPIDTSSQDGDGFYMMYQDAATGKNISVDII